jgi:hypothetical protein
MVVAAAEAAPPSTDTCSCGHCHFLIQTYANPSPKRLFVDRAISSLGNEDQSAVYVVLANEMSLLAGFAATYVLVFAANNANPFSHGNSIRSS